MQITPVLDDFSLEQIVPFFQPILNLHNQKVLRYECLSRLVSKTDNVYLPAEFMCIVSGAKSNINLTQKMIELSRAYCLPRRMNWSINIFQTDLQEDALFDCLEQLCSEEFEQLVGIEFGFELVKNHPHLLSSIAQKFPNLHITIDDADSDDPQLFNLVNSGVDAVKLNADLLYELSQSAVGKCKISKLLEHCRSLDCQMIAERIENANALQAATASGINYGQGFYLSQLGS